MENKKDYYELKVDFYPGENIKKVLLGTNEEENLKHILIFTDFNRFIIIDISE